MMSKLTTGTDASGALRYDIEKEKAQVLFKNNVFGHTAEEMGKEFRAVSDQRNIKNNTFHISLSLDKENATPEQWKIVTETYLEKMGFDLSKAQYVATLHSNSAHPHLHLCVNRIQLDGSVISDSKSYERSHQATRAAELASGLTQYVKTAEMGRDGKMANLRSTIKDALFDSKSYTEFKTNLQKHGIEIIENKSKNTDRVSGISFKLESTGQTWKGSAVGKDYSYNSIQKALNPQHTNTAKPVNEAAAQAKPHPHRGASPQTAVSAANAGAATQARVNAQQSAKDSHTSQAKNSQAEDERKRLSAIKHADRENEDEDEL